MGKDQAKLAASIGMPAKVFDSSLSVTRAEGDSVPDKSWPFQCAELRMTR